MTTMMMILLPHYSPGVFVFRGQSDASPLCLHRLARQSTLSLYTKLAAL